FFCFNTYLFIIKMAWAGIDDLLMTSLSVYPGSEIFERLSKQNKINFEDEYFLSLSSQGSLNVSPTFSNHYSRTELHLFKMGGFMLFYSLSLMIRPWRLVLLIRELCSGQGTTRLSMALINLRRRMLKLPHARPLPSLEFKPEHHKKEMTK
ncbi:MAG: hypothetical protein HY537_08060, partial [Deltaproteobacteria bacterium]|nr:hypothetical protein [Deltaproteobacteria bacterium]